MPRLIVGLGNPGNEYEDTRHNVAWKVMDALSFSSRLAWKEKFKGYYSQISIGEDNVYLLKPQTYMNLSGESVSPALKFFKIDLSDLIVIHDEIDLPFGTIHLKEGGGLAGNNGLKSIAGILSTKEFKRLRVGVGRPKFGDVSAHVLGKFNEEERPYLNDFFQLGAEALEYALEHDFKRAQNKYSKKKVI